MPRYRFSWENIPHDVLVSLCVHLGLPTGSPAETLRKEFGTRPREAFVRAAWPTLRDDWLAKHDDVRHAVVTSLRAAGLGDLRLKPTGRDLEIEYLAGLRNAKTLREKVLQAFVKAGEKSGTRAAEVTAQTRWADLAGRLTNVLAALGEGEYVVITAMDDSRAGTRGCFVQFANLGQGLHAETISNQFLAPELHLDETELGDLAALGWSAPNMQVGGPDPGPGRSPNHFTDWSRPAPFAEAAQLTVTTLRDVFDLPSPDVLTWDKGTFEGAEPDLPDLGLRRSAVEESEQPHVAIFCESEAQLRSHTQTVLSGLFEGDEVNTNDDGDFLLPYGSALTFIRPVFKPPALLFYAPLLVGIQPSERML